VLLHDRLGSCPVCVCVCVCVCVGGGVSTDAVVSAARGVGCGVHAHRVAATVAHLFTSWCGCCCSSPGGCSFEDALHRTRCSPGREATRGAAIARCSCCNWCLQSRDEW
jgi:hypothetical protein